MKKKPNSPRNWHAINAQFRNSAGAMKSKRKWDDDEKKSARDWLYDAEVNDLHEEEIRLSWCEQMERETGHSGSSCYCHTYPEQYDDHRKGNK